MTTDLLLDDYIESGGSFCELIVTTDRLKDDEWLDGLRSRRCVPFVRRSKVGGKSKGSRKASTVKLSKMMSDKCSRLGFDPLLLKGIVVK